MMFIFNVALISLFASVCVQAETETEPVHVPPYTTYLEDTVAAFVVLIHDLKLTTPQSAEFLKIFIAVIDLADHVAEKGENAYPEFYMETVENALKQVTDNRLDAYMKLWDHLKNTNKELKKILTFVLHEQVTKCVTPTSYACDLIIASGLNRDSDMKGRAHLLVTGGKQAKEFLEISNRFRIALNSEHYDAEKFLVTSSNVMKPLVLRAHETLKVVDSLNL